MSSKNFKEIVALFEALPPDERKAFTAIVKADAQSRGFNLTKLVTAKADDGIKCPHCNCVEPKSISKFGIRSGVQRYLCKSCERTFSGITDSFLCHTKKDFFTWKTFVRCMMDGRSIRKSADVCKLSLRTAFVWRHKILDALAQYQSNLRMTGIVEVGDTYIPLSFKGNEPPDRESRKRGEAASKQGISKEQVCVSCAVDRTGQFFSRVSTLGRPSARAIHRVLKRRLLNDAILCTDKDRAYVKFAAKNNFEHVPLKGGTARLGVYHVQNVNAYHSRLKHFLRRFKGVSTKYLNNYLVWNNAIQEGGRSRITLLELCMKAMVFTRWHDVSCRPAVPV